MEKNIKSVLSMDKLMFDKIDFERINFKNERFDFEFKMDISIGYSPKNDSYRVTLKLLGEKEEEYSLSISLTGFFTFNEDEGANEQLKKNLIEKNAVAIMMPYLRSQVSLITAQPNVNCIVLPPFNVNSMLSDND